MRRKLLRWTLPLSAALLVCCRLFLTDPGLAAGAVVYSPHIRALPADGPCPRIHVRQDGAFAEAGQSAGAHEAEGVRQAARLWIMGLRSGAEALSRHRAVNRYFMSAASRLPLAAMIYGAEGPDRAVDGRPDFILEPRPLEAALLMALQPGPLYGAWQQLLKELEQTLAQDVMPDSAEERRQIVRLSALIGPARKALAGADENWLAPPELALELEHAANAVEDSPLLWLLLAEAVLQRDQPQRGVGACGRALELKPGLARARYIRALGYWRLHQLALAENDLSIILHGTPEPHMAPWLRARGAIRLLRGNTEGMCEDFTAACMEGDCDGLEMARQQDLCRRVPEGPTMEELPPAARQRADYLGSLVLAFLGREESLPQPEADMATLLGLLAPDSSQRPYCLRQPSRAMNGRTSPLPPAGSEADGHDLPLVAEVPLGQAARQRGRQWGQDVLRLLGVDVGLAGLSEAALRDWATGRALADMGLAPPAELPVAHCRRRLWAAPAQWDVRVPLTDEVRTALWRAIEDAVGVSRQAARAGTPERQLVAVAPEAAGPPDVAAELCGAGRRMPHCPLPRLGEKRSTVWERIWDDAWFARIKSLAYALREDDAPRRQGGPADGPKDQPATGAAPPLVTGDGNYPFGWNWICWPGPEQRP